jgi:tetratricopeptide (TPR) repeat protein
VSAAPATIAEAFRLLQAGDAPAALAASREVIARQPGHARAYLAAGLALRMMGRLGESRAAIEEAVRLDPADYGAAYEQGMALAALGDVDAARDCYRRATRLRPDFAAAHFALGMDALARADWGAAAIALESAVRLDPRNPHALVNYGRLCVRRADFARAADLFRAALALAPADRALPMYLAQVELLRGRWSEGWAAYARRDQRLRFEAQCAREGVPYRVPAREELHGAALLIVGEQGLGDEIFFLRFAPALRALGARPSYAGEARLRALLQRTGMFEEVLASGEPLPSGRLRILSGDLPLLSPAQPMPPSLALAPDAERLEAMRRRLERVGPRPWVGVTWRAGTSTDVVAHALHKSAPIAGLFAALPRDGTVLSLQREGSFDELESASRALGRPIYDFSAVNTDLDDALALVALLDRHVGVSNTNVHLAAAAGATADVLVQFPPEWRWGIEGDSPWFPGLRVYRQLPDGDWSRAFAELASAGPGKRSRA